MANGILVAAEVSGGAVASITLEVLGAARRLADQKGEPVQAALIGSGVEGLAKDLIAQGADQVFVVDEPALAKYSCDGFVAAMEKVNAAASPSAILMGQSDMGRDLGPRARLPARQRGRDGLPERLRAGRQVLAERPCYGGNARAVHSFNTTPAVISIRSKAQEPLDRDDVRQGQVTKVDAGVDAGAIRDKIVGHVESLKRASASRTPKSSWPADAESAAPRASRSSRSWRRLLGGAVGATRAACDNGWRPVSEQIGLTGKIVGPTLYFAVGISGASQHMAGCSGSKNIVAINKDPEAIVFKSSRFGIVDDYKKGRPALAEACKKLKA